MEIGELLGNYHAEGRVSKSKGLVDWENKEVHKITSPSIDTFSNGIMVHVTGGTTISMTYTLDSVRVNLHEKGKTYFIYNSVGFDYINIVKDVINRFRIDGRDDISSFILEHNLAIIEVMGTESIQRAS